MSLLLVAGLKPGQARSLICKDYETAVSLRGGGNPVRAIGRACQFGGKWYVVNFTESEIGH
jgi:hypothetical protein